MSFLSQIRKQKEKLKETETVVTRVDGKKYVEGADSVVVEPSAYGFIIDTKPDDIPVLISNNVYIGSQDCADHKVCSEYNIKHVLSLGVYMKVSDLNQKFVQMLDLPDTDIGPLLLECLCFIRAAVEKRENVLIHCNAGVSRTSTVAIAYLMHYESMEFANAYALVKTKRPAVRPNDGFIKQLKNMEHGNLFKNINKNVLEK